MNEDFADIIIGPPIKRIEPDAGGTRGQRPPRPAAHRVRLQPARLRPAAAVDGRAELASKSQGRTPRPGSISVRLPLGSRFCCNCSGVTLLCTPSAGHFHFRHPEHRVEHHLAEIVVAPVVVEMPAGEAEAASAVRRVPPPRPRAAARRASPLRARPGLPSCGPSLRFIVLAGGTAVRIGVTPFIPSRKRMWKYHSSRILNGFTPRVMGCFGNVLKSASQCGFTDQWISNAPPIQSRNSFWPFSFVGSTRVMHARQPDALVHQRADGLQPVVLEERMPAAAVAVNHDRRRAGESRLGDPPASRWCKPTDVTPGTWSRQDLSSRQPARCSCSPGRDSGSPAMKTIFLSAALVFSAPRLPPREGQ